MDGARKASMTERKESKCNVTNQIGNDRISKLRDRIRARFVSDYLIFFLNIVKKQQLYQHVIK